MNEPIQESSSVNAELQSNQSDKIDKLAKALSVAQSQITGAKKNATNPFFKSGYADLHEVIECCREILSKCGLSVVQLPHEKVYVVGSTAFLSVGTMLMHESGQWIKSFTPIPVEKPVNAHKLGSAITYGRRYGLAAMIGIAQTDDDGNAATEKPRTMGGRPSTGNNVYKAQTPKINDKGVQ